jgi:hypothetical protein
MSGGYIRPQKEGEHQVVVFTFVGKLDANAVSKWNDAVAEFKKLFDPGLVGVTIQGDPTPAKYLRMARKSPKKK